MLIIDPETKLPIGDPDLSPLSMKKFPTKEMIHEAYATLILSASGWRKVFADDGSEESRSETIKDEDVVLVALMAKTFADFIKTKCLQVNAGDRGVQIALGIDARFTGPLMAHIMMRVFLSEGIGVKYLYIVAAPEIMAYARSQKEINGFVYISASHNPIGHNGVKFGLKEGGVLGQADSTTLIEYFRSKVSNDQFLIDFCNAAGGIAANAIKENFSNFGRHKKEAEKCYLKFARRVVSGLEGETEQDEFFFDLNEQCRLRPFGIVGELNGSARSTTIDELFFASIGLRKHMVNNKPRQIVHRIVPEGESLDLCSKLLENCVRKDSTYQIGYVPDNDGDRGNLVYFDFHDNQAKPISAQQVFALAVLSELAHLSCGGLVEVDKDGRFVDKVAVAVNGPTSLRIDRIAEVFGAEIFRAEVGEANVVELARQLRNKGYIVRIMGEGSNGGNITYPAAVRDPLSTVLAVTKLICLKGSFDLWCSLSSENFDKIKRLTVDVVLRTLPAYITTSAYEPEAIMKVNTEDQILLKEWYEREFLTEWGRSKNKLKEKYGISSWKEFNTEGTEERCGFGPDFRRGNQKGGLKIQFYNDKNRAVAFLWMRGSGTEPVFRVLVDVEGDNKRMEQDLLSWHRGIIEKADRSNIS